MLKGELLSQEKVTCSVPQALVLGQVSLLVIS